MTAIDRTAYPRLDARLTPSELAARHELTAAELDFRQISCPGVRPDG